MSGHRISKASSPHGVVSTLVAVLLAASSIPAATRTLMVLNPWDGQLGITPRASFDGGASWLTTKTAPGFCGWYSVAISDTVKSVRFTTGAKDTTKTIALRWTGDTMYVSGASTASPLVSKYYNGLTGMCLVAQLPATIRDFDSGGRSPDFDSAGYPVDTLFKGLVKSTLGDDGTPVASVASAKYFKKFDQWFHSIDSVNATTCIEIPLALNATGANKGLYTKYDSVYFPIDTFQNKFNNLVTRPKDERYRAAEDSVLHNFSFCMESHAEFVYTPGQKFKFSGDDDVWAFIDKKLVIDLGGIHSESTDSVLLDTMELVAGKTYSWDFFFCERHVDRSHLRIVTDLNLRGSSTFSIDKQAGATSKITVFTIDGDRPGLGCAARIQYPSLGRFQVIGSTSTTILGTGTSFGGITVDSELGSVSIDTSKLTGLAPGNYILRTLAWGDTTTFQDFSFTIPPLPIPVFAGSKSPYSGAIGTGLWIPVTEIRPDNDQSTGLSVAFLMRSQPGLTFCLDSLCTQKLGAQDTLMTGTEGTPRWLWVRGDAVGTYDLVVKTAGGDSTDLWPDLTFFGLAPDSGWFVDRNGDGRADGAVVYSHQPWSTSNILRLAWPGKTDTLTIANSEIAVSPDSLRLVITLAPSRAYGVDRTAATNPTDSLGEWGWDASSTLSRFHMRDSIAPVPVLAWLAYGATEGEPDTLKVTSSEPLRSLTQTDVARIFHAAGATWTMGNQIGQNLSSSGDTLLLIYDPDEVDIEPAPGDSVRFSPRAGTADTLGNRPGDTAKAVVIQGADRAPLWAKIFDTNGDGRADQIVMRFRGPLRNTSSFDFLWPDTNGNLEMRHVELSETRTDSGGLLVIASLAEPFAFGSTSCPAAGCADLGRMHTWLGSVSVEIKFPVLDGVDPIILSAELRFSFVEGQPDTLKLVFSEDISIDSAATVASSPWVAWGHDSRDSLGSVVPYLGYNRIDATHADLLVRVSDSFPLAKTDSLRISMDGALSDTSENQPEALAHWTAISFGPTPLRLRATPYIPVRTYHESWGEPSKTDPNVTILVRGSSSEGWHTLDGSTTSLDTSRLSGVVLRTDRMVIGGFYLYDNMGVFVTSADVGAVNKALIDGTLVPDARGFYEVFFAWNGRADGGRMASTGVYYTRIFGWKIEETERVLINEIHPIGWRVIK
jgi:fibro-slime domain-containing protein